MRRLHSTGRVWTLCLAGVLVGGCQEMQDFFKTDEHRWMAADLVWRSPDRPRVDPIQRWIGVADQHEDAVPNAVPPREEDYTYREEDYVIGTTDVVDITIMDLYTVGVETLLRREVSDAGYIDLPLLPERIKASGLAQEQLKDAIKGAYRDAGILRDPIVSVSVVARRQNTFSVIGAVARQGTYNILRKDMRMLEALALAGDVNAYNVQYIYVIRMAPAIKDANANGGGPARRGPAEDVLGPLPKAIAPGEIPTTTSAPTTQGELEDIRRLVPGPGPAPGGPTTLPAPSAVPALSDTGGPSGSGATSSGAAIPPPKRPRFVYSNGRWVQVEGGGEETTAPASGPTTAPADPFEAWRRAQKSDLSRVIAINYRELQRGNARMNIVIRENDVINVPREEVGEFYVGGLVARPGVYSLTGRQITVKMAVVAAGNLSQDSWPQNSILIRRIADNQEMAYPLDIEAIFRGQQSDLYLRPDDVIAVGSSIRQPFLAVFRNAFRFTYGAGFVYDRNFASAAPTGLNSLRFLRW